MDYTPSLRKAQASLLALRSLPHRVSLIGFPIHHGGIFIMGGATLGRAGKEDGG